MKLCSFVLDRAERFGIVREGGIVDLAGRTNRASLADALATMEPAQLRQWKVAAPDLAFDHVQFLPVIPRPRHIICVGTNYTDHIAEVVKAGVKRDRPAWPSVFLRTVESLAAHLQPIIRPRVSECLDFEGELAVIVGRAGRYIQEADALSYVAGYTCFSDASVRDWQFHTNNITPGKNFPATGSLGPWMTTADEIRDPGQLGIRTRLNGAIVQDGNTSDMIFNVPQIISYASSFMSLTPGDVIATGTPAGVGFSRKPPLFMAAGDVCEIEIEAIGTLRNTIFAEQP